MPADRVSSIPGADDTAMVLEWLTRGAESRLARALALRSATQERPPRRVGPGLPQGTDRTEPMHATGSSAPPPALSGPSGCPLTPREREVAALIARGLLADEPRVPA